jgi:hypothetical protein
MVSLHNAVLHPPFLDHRPIKMRLLRLPRGCLLSHEESFGISCNLGYVALC